MINPCILLKSLVQLVMFVLHLVFPVKRNPITDSILIFSLSAIVYLVTSYQKHGTENDLML